MMLTDFKGIDQLISIRTNDLSESIELYLKFADRLLETEKTELISRAEFIKQQCSGFSGQYIFEACRQTWGIPNFSEELVTVEDFKRGFLWIFRDHTTSWSDNQHAKEWFLTSAEAKFVRHYEFWTYDNEFDECIEHKEGSYKEILLSLLKEADYDVLISPVFSNKELQQFIKNYSITERDFTIEEIIEDYIALNPNYVASKTIVQKIKYWLNHRFTR